MTNFYKAKFEDEEERQWYKQEALNAGVLVCIICDNVIGYMDDISSMEDATRQTPAIFFCVKCRQLAEREIDRR